MKMTHDFRRFFLTAGAALLGICAIARIGAASYHEVFSFAEVAGTTGSRFNYGAAVDADAVYFSLNSSPAITKIDGSGTSIIMTSADWAAASTKTTLTSFYGFESMGDYLVFGESSADQIWKVEKATGAISVVASTADIEAVTGFSATQLLAAKGVCGDDYYFYEGESDGILKVNVPTGVVSTVATAAQLDAFASSTGVAGGLACDGAGQLHVGDNTNDAIYKWDGTSGFSVLSTAEILAVTGADSAGFGDMLFGEDGLMYFYETTSDGILSFDPLNPAASLRFVLTEDQLLSGPMGSDNISGLAWYDGNIAFTGMGQYGFYVVPEPTVLGLLLGIAGLALLRSRRA